MTYDSEFDSFTPEERRAEIARLLSLAYLRLRARGGCVDDPVKNATPSAETCLEVSPESRLTVPTG